MGAKGKGIGRISAGIRASGYTGTWSQDAKAGWRGYHYEPHGPMEVFQRAERGAPQNDCPWYASKNHSGRILSGNGCEKNGGNQKDVPSPAAHGKLEESRQAGKGAVKAVTHRGKPDKP